MGKLGANRTAGEKPAHPSVDEDVTEPIKPFTYIFPSRCLSYRHMGNGPWTILPPGSLDAPVGAGVTLWHAHALKF